MNEPSHPDPSGWPKEHRDLLNEAAAALEAVRDLQELERLRAAYLGRKGKVSSLFDRLRELPAAERPAFGKAANELKRAVAELVEQARERVGKQAAAPRPAFDPTLPPLRPPRGHLHPVTRTFWEIIDVFRTLGFEVVRGPEVEDDWHNFEALNIPPEHPARDEWDTFYLTDHLLLRPHTSPGQIRAMRSRRPPLRIVVPGRCFRRDTEDARHFSMFHQLEGLMVDEKVSFADLKAVLHMALRQFFRREVAVRFEPDFFPFTEPSAQVHCTCVLCGGEGCQTCSYSGWLELLGCGMVDPNVFQAVGYDPERYQGFAFGMGIDRLAMLKYRIPDGRMLFQGDVRFLAQF